MMPHVLHFEAPSRVIKRDELVALFASMIAVFYDDDFLAKGYGVRPEQNSPNCGMCRASQGKLIR